MASLETPWWHVAWATFLAWPPTDERGDWRDLPELYAQVAAAGGSATPSEPLPSRWQGRAFRLGHVALATTEQELLASDILDLASEDRVAGDTAVAALAVEPCRVQVVLACPTSALSQRVGRLKSRSAALLSSRRGLAPARHRVWGRGVWSAGLMDQVAVDLVSAFVAAAKHPA